jgi:hypothetical protein
MDRLLKSFNRDSSRAVFIADKTEVAARLVLYIKQGGLSNPTNWRELQLGYPPWL